MPEKETLERAKKDKDEGKAPSTQAGEFVREEIEHVREGKHGARSTKQAIAIGLSKARRAGVKLEVPKKGSKKMRKLAARDLKKGKKKSAKKSVKRSRATSRALKREGLAPLPNAHFLDKHAARRRDVLLRLARERQRKRHERERSKCP
jgi:uncharacterized protein DUF6496